MKKSKKILSVVLALVMVFSAVGATFAASAADEKTYTPKYTETVTKEAVTSALGAVDALVASLIPGALYTNGMIDTLYGLYDLLKLQKPAAGTDYGVKDSATFAAKAKEVINGLLGANVDLTDMGLGKMPIKSAIPAVASILGPTLTILDHLLNTTLGLDVGMPFESTVVDEATGKVKWDITADNITNLIDWLVKVIDKFVPNLVTNVLELLPILAEESTLIEVADLLESLSGILAIANFDVNTVLYDTDVPEETAAPSEAAAAAEEPSTEAPAPVMKKALDLNKILALVSGIEVNGAPIGLKFADLNLNNLRGLKDAADVFMVVYHYVYQNAIANADNAKILFEKLIPSLLDSLLTGEDSQGTKDMITGTILPMLYGDEALSEEDLLSMLITLLKDDGGDTEEPTTPTTKPADKNPGTGDAALSAVAMVSVAAAAAFVLTKKKHA